MSLSHYINKSQSRNNSSVNPSHVLMNMVKSNNKPSVAINSQKHNKPSVATNSQQPNKPSVTINSQQPSKSSVTINSQQPNKPSVTINSQQESNVDKTILKQSDTINQLMNELDVLKNKSTSRETMECKIICSPQSSYNNKEHFNIKLNKIYDNYEIIIFLIIISVLVYYVRHNT